MKDKFVELNDLPDEILLNILKKLDNVEVLNSLIDINKRFNTIVHDSIFTSYLSFMKYSSKNSIHYALPDSILDRFCSQILPEIQQKINWLDLESTSIERILLSTNYLNLNGLGLYNIDIDKAISVFIGGLFKYVRDVLLYDEYPFAYEFFLRIAQSFPVMEKLSGINKKPQISKQSNNNNEYLSIIEYPYLTSLVLNEVHDDYIELFLDHTKICLSDKIFLSIQYHSLERVTHHFQREATRINCAKLRFLCIYRLSSIPEHVKDYFPNTKISCH